MLIYIMYFAVFVISFLFFTKSENYEYALKISKNENTGIYGYLYNFLMYNFNPNVINVSIKKDYSIKIIVGLENVCYEVLSSQKDFTDLKEFYKQYEWQLYHLGNSGSHNFLSDISNVEYFSVLPPRTAKLIYESWYKMSREFVKINQPSLLK